MLLDLSRFQAQRTHVERRYDASALDTREDDFRVVEPIALVFDVEKSGNRYRLTGRATSVLEQPCSRCAEPFRLPVDAAFDLTYLPQSENTGDEEQEVAQEDVDTSFYAEGTIDLAQLLREQFYLSLPMKPLCREDCKGLCVVCGANRNTAPCDCDPQWEDPRLAPLKGLLGQPPGSH